ncbi:MAG: hydrogenase maturation protease [Candidatus Dormibacteria bacterium]
MPKILVAGIGNVFLSDDAFGVEVAALLLGRQRPDHVTVGDFGIRGFDLAYALMEDYDLAILVDALPRGEPPGTLYVLEPDPSLAAGAVEGHAMNPMAVFSLVAALGGTMPRVLIVGCEPQSVEEGMGLSEPVAAALQGAVEMVENLVKQEEMAWVG